VEEFPAIVILGHIGQQRTVRDGVFLRPERAHRPRIQLARLDRFRDLLIGHRTLILI
jgi:hypothetical protein